MKTNILLFLFSISSILILLAYIFLGIWLYKDCKNNGADPIIWLLIVILTPYFLGLLLYFLLVKNNPKVICSNCKSKTYKNSVFCSLCGKKLDSFEEIQKTTNKKYLIIFLTLFISFIVIIFSFGFFVFKNLDNNPIPLEYSESFKSEN